MAEAEKRREAVTAQIYPLAAVDYVLEEILGLPGTRDLLITPRDILDVLGIPTPDEIIDEIRKRIEERAKAKVR
ncbi:MAG: hypothetical protein QW618_01620 [Nitrososphaerales archaeon]